VGIQIPVTVHLSAIVYFHDPPLTVKHPAEESVKTQIKRLIEVYPARKTLTNTWRLRIRVSPIVIEQRNPVVSERIAQSITQTLHDIVHVHVLEGVDVSLRESIAILKRESHRVHF
jgi:hypothetical protein